jgi:uncharacterized protein (TIGR03000 family)
MVRFLTPVLLLALLGDRAVAQFRLPLSPGVAPASPFGPGAPMRPRFVAPQTGFRAGYGNSGFGYGGFGYGGFLPYYPGYAGYGAYAPPFGFAGGGVPFPLPIGPPGRVVNLSNEFPAVLTLQLPRPGEVWLNGQKAAGPGEELTLVSRVLKPGERFTFDVKARWQKGGKTYEAKRSVALGPNEHSRLMILSGDEVRD